MGCISSRRETKGQEISGPLWQAPRSVVGKERNDSGLVAAAHVGGKAQLELALVVRDLVGTRLTLHLSVDLENLLNAGGAHRVAEADETSTSVDGKLAVDVGVSVGGKVGALPVVGQAERLIHEHLSDGEAVMHLKHTKV